MTRSIRGSRRAALLLAGTAAATGLLVSGCGTGQIAETANKQPSVQGVNAQTPDDAHLVRSLYVEYPGPGGYQAGENATVNAVLYNDTASPVTVTVTTDSARDIVITSASASPAASASPSATESAAPSESGAPAGSASPAAPAGEPARVEIPAYGYVQLNVEGGRFLQLVGLNERRLVGETVNLVFDFGDGKIIRTPAPIGVPLTPAPRPTPIIEREGELGSSHS